MGGKYFRLKMIAVYALFITIVSIWAASDANFVRFAITYFIIWLLFFLCAFSLLKEDVKEYYKHFSEASKVNPEFANRQAVDFLMVVIPAVVLGPLFILCAIPFAWNIPLR